MIYVSARATVWAVTRITQQLSRGMLLYKGGHKPSILKADPMTMWLGIVLGAMAFAGTAISGSTADYIGLLGGSHHLTQATLNRFLGTAAILRSQPYFED